MSGGYVILPQVYDRWQQSYGKDFTTLILPRFFRTLRKYRAREKSLLDLACGTGTLAIAMEQKGWFAMGVDASPGMIAEAQSKAGRSGSDAMFFCQDMRAFTVPAKVAVVTSFFDSVNHILDRRDLLKVFEQVREVLQPGGLFVFDTNNELCYRTLWTKTDTMDHKDFTLVLQSRYNTIRKRAYSDVLLFFNGKNGPAQFSETVEERCYSHDQIKTLLTRAGLLVRQCEDFNFASREELGKVKTWWVAERV